MIKSVLDTDLYKLTMQQAVFQLYPDAEVRYEFINRGHHQFKDEFAQRLRMWINGMGCMKLTAQERGWLKKMLPFLSDAYVDYLVGYRYKPHEVSVVVADGDLKLTIEGPWHSTILWEVPLLASISELCLSGQQAYWYPHLQTAMLDNKDRVKALAFKDMDIKYADFGTRRRYSSANHERVIRNLKEFSGDAFVGTSNVDLAQRFGLRPIGTQGHEWTMFHGAIFGYRMANELALQRWVDVFHGDLGIALSDTFTTDVFLDAFGMKYAKLFDGVRQDSGDPVAFMEKMIGHYEGLGIDPISKTIVFSDGLNVEKVLEIEAGRAGRIKAAYGIGTSLTNDIGVKPLDMVIKMTACRMKGGRWVDAVKLSDSCGKYTGEPREIDLCKMTLDIEGSG